MFVSETYDICDAWKYDSNVYENSSPNASVVDLNYDNLPSNYIVTYEDYYVGSVNQYKKSYLIIGQGDNTRVTFGTVEGTTYEMAVNNNVAWSSATKLMTNESSVAEQWKKHSLTVENGTVTFKNVNSSNTSSITLNKLWRYVLFQDTKIRNITILPL